MNENRDALLERALATIKKLREKLESSARPVSEEPIAIVGIACEFPGGIRSLEQYWQLLSSGGCAVDVVPESRRYLHQVMAAIPDAGVRQRVRHMGLVSDPYGFDNKFFGISPKEALHLDPQHRLLLELTWRAIEFACINPLNLRDSDTGVFVGIGNSDYYQSIARHSLEMDAYVASGNAPAMAAGRLSYFFGFKGPSLAFDTACSSSLVGVNLACQALQRGDCRTAVVAAVNLVLTELISVNFAIANMLAEDGRCKVFSDGADGYVRAEGAAVLVLKRLSDALEANDPILAIVRSSAVNQDGRSHGLTAPNGPSQRAVIEKALAEARLDLDDIDYLEAHGTGTKLGDPVELNTLSGLMATRQQPLFVGSAKANLGHLEPAAGMAGLLKVIAALRAGVIPRQIHCEDLNSHVDWPHSRLRIPRENMAWPHTRARRIAAVSGFGFSGTNAHVIIESAPAPTLFALPATEREWIFATSAATPESLQRLVDAHIAHLSAADASPGGVSFTACCCRAHFPYRFATSYRNLAELGRALQRAQLADVAPPSAQPAAFSLILGPDCCVSLANLTRGYHNHPLVTRFVQEANDAWRALHGRPLLVDRDEGYALADGEPAVLADLLATILSLRLLDALDIKCTKYIAWGSGFAALAHHLGELDLPAAMTLVTDEMADVVATAPSRAFLDRVTVPTFSLKCDPTVRRNWFPIVESRTRSVLVDGVATWLLLCRESVARGDKATVRVIHEHSFAALVAALYRAGAEVAWKQQFAGGEQRKEALPCYEFSHTYFNVCSPIEEAGAVSQVRTDSSASPSHLYAETWKEAALCTGSIFTPDLDRAVASVAGHVEVQDVIAKYARYTRMVQDAEALCERAALHLFKYGLGVERASELELVAAHPERCLDPGSSHKPLVAHLARRLLISPQLQDFAAIPRSVLPEVSAFAQRNSEFPIEGELLHRCLGSLIDVIQGTTDPKTILFSGGADSLASRVYKTSVTNDYLNKQVQLLVRELVANHRGERKLRILEIGAGTGATTEMVVGELDPARVDYHFTDISPFFLNLAGQRFGSLGCFDFRLLNIEDFDSVAPLCGRRYDLVIAVNVLHATSSIDRSVQHVSELLLEGGVLILRECTKPTLTADLSFGLTPGWWRYTDFELRKDYPLLNCQQWDVLLGQHGFEPSRTTLGHDSGYENIIVARRGARRAASDMMLVLHRNERADLAGLSHGSPRCAMAIEAFLAADAASLPMLDAPAFDVVIADLSRVPSDDVSADALVDRYFHDMVAVLHKLAESYPRRTPRVYLLTRGAEAVVDSDRLEGLGQALTTGLARVAAREFPDSFRTIVDVDVDELDAALGLLEPEMQLGAAEQEVAYRRGVRYVRRLEKRSVPDENPSLIRDDASYLIAGGLGGLGLSTAEWLARRGARHLVLLSRACRDLADGSEAATMVLALRERGVEVVLSAVDVSDAAAMKQVFLRFGTEFPPLRGIVHSAGIGGDRSIRDNSRGELDGMFATKVKGSLNLHRLSQDHRLDFFVVYSSMIATWGAVHRAHYAAVNHFSDQLILQRNRLGLPGLSIDWGPWSGSGMLKHDAETRAKWLGVDSLKPVRYLCTLGRLLDVHSQGVAIAVEADWQRIYQSYSQHSPMFLFEDLLGPRETATVAESGERPDLGDDSTLRVGIRTAFSELLGYADAREIAEERGFFEQGMDSLLAIRFGEILHERLQVTVKTTDLFSYNSVAKLAEFLAGRGGDDRRLPQPSRAALSFNRIETPMLGAEPMSRSALLDALAEFEESLNEVAQ